MTAREWPIKELGAGLSVKHGFAFKGEFFRDSGDLIVLTPGNFLEGGGFKLKSKEKFYNGPVPDGYLLRRGNVVVAMTEQSKGLLGSTATVPADDKFLHNQRLGLLQITDPGMLDLRYCYHLLNSPDARNQIQATATGSKVRHTAPERIKSVRVALPELAYQRKVASALDSVEALIENNRRRIEILEEMARLIYREWFVHFRFPGHEDVEFVDSDLGPIPGGWNVGVIDDLGDVVTGSTPPTKEASLYGGLAPFLTPSDMTGERFVETARSLSEQGIERFERRMVPPGSVCFTCIGSIGKLAVAADRLLTNQQINSVVPLSPYSSGFIYQLLQDRSEYVLSIASGAATPIVNKSTFKAVEVLLPHPDVLASFDRVECPMGELVRTLTYQNRVLGEARGLLLPRLISGELDVSGLDLDLEPVA